MARFLVLDWDHRQLQIVSASIANRSVRIQRAAVFHEEHDPNSADAATLGRILRERLKTADIAPAPVLACVGRDRVILKEVHYPPAPAAEEPAVVRFQVAKELHDSAEEVVIDYVVLGKPESAGERRALALILQRGSLTTYRELCREAGLKLTALVPRVFGTIACRKRLAAAAALNSAPEPPGATVGILTIRGALAEFCVVRGETLLLARSLAAGPALPGEIRRNLAVYAGQSAREPVRTLYVAGREEHAEIRQRLGELAGIPVHSFDPFAGAEQPGVPAEERGGFAGAVGLLDLHAERGGLPMNFVQPKEPKPPRDPNRRRVATIAAVAAACLIGAISVCYAKLAARDRELDALFQKKADLERQLSHFEDGGKCLKALKDWIGSEIVWLDELYDLTDRFPDPETLRLTQLTGDPLTRAAKDKHVARMTLKGITTNEYQMVDTLVARLVEDGHYRVEPKILSRNSGAERMRFPQQFTTRVDIEKLPPDQYTRRMLERPALAGAERGRNRRRGDGLDFGFGGFEGGAP